MYTVIFLSVVTNAFFVWLLFYSHRKGERHVLGVGLFFMVISLVILVALYVRNYHADAPAGMKEQVFDEYNEKIEWLLAIFGFVPAVFTGNMISKGLDAVYLRRQARQDPVNGAGQGPATPAICESESRRPRIRRRPWRGDPRNGRRGRRGRTGPRMRS